MILGTFFVIIGLRASCAEMFRIAETGTPDFEKWSFIGYPLPRSSTAVGLARSTRGTRSCGSSTSSAS